MNQNVPYTPPSFKADGFNCPFCRAFAEQHWGGVSKVVHIKTTGKNINYGADENLMISRCGRCNEFSVWVDQKMMHPKAVLAPQPNQDIPDEVKTDFEEARLIVSDSPRGAAALLRLVIQKICKHLGESGKNINNDVASLVKKGLPPKIQQALDIVRVIGNNAVHPGQLDLKDDIDTANQLFSLINLIADVMITQPKHVEEMYKNLIPQAQKDAINKRDGS